ncbi:lipid-A-disaccharide synthase [Pararhodospirillum oryzae]|uniref:Lipid-A-disaccharide synthase n=1 Tax=Pararhodospirillum oryzae TaxID=478448 RepID=A0A512H8H7_9PROT|nr:lipid-A-disaccharide synthase [Pararhodospirillum oryzae]GEO81747.1 lipid-A-disaccharide synthase [Pararhodospirillum oryzae]
MFLKTPPLYRAAAGSAGTGAGPARAPQARKPEPLIYLIAGEPSGDQLGALLMRALKTETNGQIRFAGIGGEQMTAEGLISRVPLSDLAVMGFLEVVPALRRIRRRLRETVDDIGAQRPDLVLTIDSWGFTGRVQAALTQAAHPALRVHYVAPMVWVWKAGRVRSVAARVHHLLCLWPFEPALFEAAGVAATHVGHAVVESGVDRGDGAAFRARHGLADDALVLAVLPGSRRGEVRRLLPVFRETVARVSVGHPGMHVVIPTLEHLRAGIEAATADWPVPVTVVGGNEKADAFKAARAALAASGTVSLELALAGVPHCIAYKVHPLSAALFRRLMARGTRFVNMINILMDREIVPELLQEACQPEILASVVTDLLDSDARRQDQAQGLAAVIDRLRGKGASPSQTAARTLLALLTDTGRSRE